MSTWVKLANEIGESLTHHPREKTINIGEVELRISEKAVDILGHNIQYTVLESPGNKIDKEVFGPYGAPSAKASKEQCLFALTKRVNQIYNK